MKNTKNIFIHQSSNSTGLNQAAPRSSPTFCLKLSLENLLPSTSSINLDENCELCVNLFLSKENPCDSYFLCENAYFPLSQTASNVRGSVKPSGSTQNLTADTSPTSCLQINSIGKCALFCDISEKDFELTNSGYKLFLIAYVVKKLKINSGPKHASISRFFSGGVCDLGAKLCNLIKVEADHRHIQNSMILNTVEYFESSIVSAKNIQEFFNTKDLADSYKLIKNTAKENSFTLAFRCELVEATYKKAFDQFAHLQPFICRKMDFPETIMPDDIRNDFYITVVGGDFQKARNYEFLVSLVQFKSDNEAIEETPIDLNDEGAPSELNFFYKSIVYAKQEKPKWNEIVNVSIPHGKPIGQIKKAYVRFLIRNRPLGDDKRDKTKVIGRCYLQITNEDGSAIEDNHLFLPVNKIENENEIVNAEADFIRLKPPSTCRNSAQLSPCFKSADKLKDFIEIKVKVVSTELTQNVTLLNLLSFGTESMPGSEEYSRLLTYLDGLLSVKHQQSAEIVKLLQPILNKLIDILLDLKTPRTTEQQLAYEIHSKQVQPRVFNILVAIFQIVENQNKFASFRTVIDAYLDKLFCFTLAHVPLLRIFYQLLVNVFDTYSNKSLMVENNNFPKVKTGYASQLMSDTENSSLNGLVVDTSSKEADFISIENIFNAIKSIEYIFKFAFRSREVLSRFPR